VNEKQRPQAHAASNPDGLIAVYLIAALVGYLVGTRWVPPSAPAATLSAPTPLARIGLALTEPPKLAAEAWAGLRQDVDHVRGKWQGHDRMVFDLVVAVRGLSNGGNPDWHQAEALCASLQWPRCDRPALEALRRSSRPGGRSAQLDPPALGGTLVDPH
jgi:hypothetical protein